MDIEELKSYQELDKSCRELEWNRFDCTHNIMVAIVLLIVPITLCIISFIAMFKEVVPLKLFEVSSAIPFLVLFVMIASVGGMVLCIGTVIKLAIKRKNIDEEIKELEIQMRAQELWNRL